MNKSILFTFLFALLIVQSVSSANSNESKIVEEYTTSVGAKFTKRKVRNLGITWVDPVGNTWSPIQGIANNGDTINTLNGLVHSSPAAVLCSKINARLPLTSEFDYFSRFFEVNPDNTLTAQGEKDLKYMYPDVKIQYQTSQFWRGEWTLDVNSIPNSQGATRSLGIFGGFWQYLGRDLYVRCVKPWDEGCYGTTINGVSIVVCDDTK